MINGKRETMDFEKMISVIIPAYNVADWLERCLDSILAQTYEKLEILVIDDGSTDKTPEIIDRYAEKDHRIVAFHQTNRGLAETRDRGIREASGEYIGFVDGDDEIIPEMYERLLKNAIQYEAQISQCGILYCFYDGRRKPVYGTGKVKVYNRIDGCAALLKGSEMEPSLCNKLYLASILKDSCLDSTIMNNEDMLRNIVLFDRAERSVTEDFCGYLYWRRQASMSHNQDAVRIGRHILEARRRILDYAPEEIKNIAEINYITGAINTYHSLIGRSSQEANQLREDCISIMHEYWKKNPDVSADIKLKTWMICHVPALYDVARKRHVAKRNQRIHAQSAACAEKNPNGKEG